MTTSETVAGFRIRLSAWRDRLQVDAALHPGSPHIDGELHMAEAILYALDRYCSSNDIDDVTVCAFVLFEALQGRP